MMKKFSTTIVLAKDIVASDELVFGGIDVIVWDVCKHIAQDGTCTSVDVEYRLDGEGQDFRSTFSPTQRFEKYIMPWRVA